MGNPTNVPLTYESYQARKYLPELDGLRALSVLIVISVHMHDNRWDWLVGRRGVTVFFVLSGYLITTLALREERARGSLSLSAFYIRRCFRIFPLYYLTLAIYCFLILVLGLTPGKRALLWGALPYFLLYVQEVPFFFGLVGAAGTVEHMNIPFFQSWSLGIEEKFYLVWPLLAFVCWRGSKTLRYRGTLLLVCAFALAPSARLLDPLVPSLGLAKFGAWNKIWGCLYPYFHILIGCLFALHLDNQKEFKRIRVLGTKAGIYTTLFLFLLFHFSGPYVPELYLLYLWETFYGIATGAFLVSVLLGKGLVQQVLGLPPLVFIGKLSYGIYLIHVLCLNIALTVVPLQTGSMVFSILAYLLACGISIVVAYVLSILIEKPLIEWGRQWSMRVMDEYDRRQCNHAVQRK